MDQIKPTEMKRKNKISGKAMATVSSRSSASVYMIRNGKISRKSLGVIRTIDIMRFCMKDRAHTPNIVGQEHPTL